MKKFKHILKDRKYQILNLHTHLFSLWHFRIQTNRDISQNGYDIDYNMNVRKIKANLQSNTLKNSRCLYIQNISVLFHQNVDFLYDWNIELLWKWTVSEDAQFYEAGSHCFKKFRV